MTERQTHTHNAFIEKKILVLDASSKHKQEAHARTQCTQAPVSPAQRGACGPLLPFAAAQTRKTAGKANQANQEQWAEHKVVAEVLAQHANQK